jgi:hypothetical protein
MSPIFSTRQDKPSKCPKVNLHKHSDSGINGVKKKEGKKNPLKYLAT